MVVLAPLGPARQKPRPTGPHPVRTKKVVVFSWQSSRVLVGVVENVGLQRLRAAVAGADAHDLPDVQHKNLAVANSSGAGGVSDGLNGTI